MQVLNGTTAVQPELLNEIYEPPLSQKLDKVKVQETTTLSSSKPKNLTRLLEAYSDCV